jgi:hypothetical protein
VSTPELFPGEATLREMATQAGWSPSTGNGCHLRQPSQRERHPPDVCLLLPGGCRARVPLGGDAGGRPGERSAGLASVGQHARRAGPAPEEAMGLLDREGVVCRVGDLMPEDLTVEG